MAAFRTYLKNLFLNWWAGVGALSVVGFFVPRLNDYWPYIAAVAVVAFIAAGFGVYEEHFRNHTAEVERLRREHAASLRVQQEQHARVIAQLQAEIEELKRPKFTAETRQAAESLYRKLDRTQKIALRQLVAGDMTDRQALNYLHSKGLAMNYGSIFSGLTEIGLVQRVLEERQRGEHVTGYTGNYTVTPKFKDVLVELLERDAESKA